MRNNLIKHRVLKILSEKFISEDKNYKSKENIKANLVGLSLLEISESLKIKPLKRDLILYELNKSEEIVFYELEERGCMIDEKFGISSYSEKKYLLRNRLLMRDYLKDFVQIAIPILSLIIALIALSFKK